MRGDSSFSSSSRMISPLIVDRGDLEIGAAFLAHQLPGHDVRMVFQMRDENLVACLDELSAKAAGDQVDAFRGAAHEDDLAHRRRRQEAANLSHALPHSRAWPVR